MIPYNILFQIRDPLGGINICFNRDTFAENRCEQWCRLVKQRVEQAIGTSCDHLKLFTVLEGTSYPSVGIIAPPDISLPSSQKILPAVILYGVI